jgi:hypothetical protein
MDYGKAGGGGGGVLRFVDLLGWRSGGATGYAENRQDSPLSLASS